METKTAIRKFALSNLTNWQRKALPTGNTDKIAVIYAVGEIDGSTDSGIISSELSEKILEIANDEDIKGVVLRINFSRRQCIWCRANMGGP